MNSNKIITVICEGPSEKCYLEELNRVFREENIKIVFVPVPSCGGDYKKVIKTFKKTKKDNPRNNIIIWQDADIYIRNEKENGTNYKKKPKGIPDFLFNKNNFEDMISLHLENDMTDAWNNECLKHNHFQEPMTKRQYEPLFKELVLANYEKGTFPLVNFNLEVLKKTFEKNKNNKIKFESDFLSFLEKELNYIITI